MSAQIFLTFTLHDRIRRIKAQFIYNQKANNLFQLKRNRQVTALRGNQRLGIFLVLIKE